MLKVNLQTLREELTGKEWTDNVPPSICGVNEDSSIEEIADEVICQYGYGHELASYNGRIHEVELNGLTYYIMRTM